MKRILLAPLIALAPVTAAPQDSCLPNGIVFSSQSQVDAFPANFPGCTDITGGVTINGSDIVDLNGLSQVSWIHGVFSVVGNPLLTDLSGLNSLARLLGSQNFIANNPALEHLTGLNSLEIVDGHFFIENNGALADLTGLDSLWFCGPLHLKDNASLTTVSGLGSLTNASGLLHIEGNDSLTSLAGLSQLAKIDGTLSVTGNPVLSSLSGIDNLDSDSIYQLIVSQNATLTNCAVESICEFLAVFPDFAVIEENFAGCNDINEVKEQCEFHSVPDSHRRPPLRIGPSPTTGPVSVRLDRTPEQGRLTISTLQGTILRDQLILEKSIMIDLAGFPAGVYVIRFSDRLGSAETRIVRR